MREVLWVLEHRRDLEADFRAFYHLSPAESYELPGPEYLSLAWRTSAYGGVMAARLAELDQDQGGQEAAWEGRSAPTAPTTRDVPLGASTAALVDAEGGALGDLFD